MASLRPPATKSNRKPRGYRGIGHQTLGSDILAVTRILKLPEQVLGKAEAARLARVDPNAWYPIDWLLSLMERLDQEVGQFGLLRMGRTLFDLSHKEAVMKSARSARDIIYALDSMYHRANRGEGIGGWYVLSFEPGHAKLEKTTPHHCQMEQGILAGALAAVGCPCNVSQSQCFRQGADACVFEVSSAFTDARWDQTKAG